MIENEAEPKKCLPPRFIFAERVKTKKSVRPNVELITHLLQRLDAILRSNSVRLIENIRELSAEIDCLVPYRDGHSLRVAELSVRIGKWMKLEAAELEKLELAALLHDFGKVGVEEELLEKEEALSNEEYTEITYHALRGYYILSGFPQLEEISLIVRDHHERYDGKGYPHAKAYDGIDLLARIIAVADTYDAMTSNRPYRKAFSLKEAERRIRRASGTQFDPRIVKIFLAEVLR
ncbi:MAG: HD domain-containing phosphohydrolase [Candidatus Edwardsbacteria bacterium]